MWWLMCMAEVDHDVTGSPVRPERSVQPFSIVCSWSNSFRNKTKKNNKGNLIWMQRSEQGLSVFILNQKTLPRCRTFCFFVVALQGLRSQSTQLWSSSLLSALGFASPSWQFNCMVASHWRPWQLSCSKLHAASQTSPEKLTVPVLPRCLKHQDEMIECSISGKRRRFFFSAGWKHTETHSKILRLTASLVSPLWIHTPGSLPVSQRPLLSVNAPLVFAPFQTCGRYNNVQYFFCRWL